MNKNETIEKEIKRQVSLKNSYKKNNLKLSKTAVEAFAVPLLLLIGLNLMYFFAPDFQNSNTETLIIITIDLLVLYFITEQGFEKLTMIFTTGLKVFFLWLLPIALISFLIIMFLGLPPTTIIIVLLVLMLLKKS